MHAYVRELIIECVCTCIYSVYSFAVIFFCLLALTLTLNAYSAIRIVQDLIYLFFFTFATLQLFMTLLMGFALRSDDSGHYESGTISVLLITVNSVIFLSTAYLTIKTTAKLRGVLWKTFCCCLHVVNKERKFVQKKIASAVHVHPLHLHSLQHKHEKGDNENNFAFPKPPPGPPPSSAVAGVMKKTNDVK